MEKQSKSSKSLGSLRITYRKMKNSYLDKILEDAKNSLSERKSLIPLSKLKLNIEQSEPSRGFIRGIKESLEKNKIGIIAEIKKASPSQGVIRKEFNPIELARNYEDANATCLSVLTNRPFFEGSIDHLSEVKRSIKLPVLRKDFIVDEYQIYESKLYGADCILLIVAALSDIQLKDYLELSSHLQLDVLIEVHSEEEMERALNFNPKLIGINNRDLKTFEISLSTTERLSRLATKDIVLVSESGIKTKRDIEKIKSYGVNVFLVGETFMRSADPGRELQELFFS